MDYNISIFQDKRRKTKKGYPIKLRVYSLLTKKAKFYGLDISITDKDFRAILDPSKKVRGDNREMQIILNTIENRAVEVAKSIDPFSFAQFETKMFRSKKASISVKYHYDTKISQLINNGQVSTASNYRLSLRSIENYISKKNKESVQELTFYDLTKDFLNGYENYMVRELDKSRTTVSIYLRALRTIFNDAISSSDIKKEIYPFGKDKQKYQIPQTSGKKSALTSEQLSLLFNAKPKTPEQEKAKDFWFFSYAGSGMNIKDMALLKYKDIHKDSLTYYRAKTINTKKGNLKEIKVFLNDYSKEIIKKYGNKIVDSNYVFPILEITDSLDVQQRKIKNFTRFINQHINKLAETIGFDFKISVQWARHSFATNAIRKGASMEFISEALNHSNLKTTKNYFAGFDDDKKKEFADKLMDF